MGQALSGGLEAAGKEIDALSDDALIRAAASLLRQRPGLKGALLARLAAPIDFETPGPSTAEAAEKSDGITLVYYSTWRAPHVHCRAGPSQPWTQAPGLPLGASAVDEFPARSGDGGWFAISFPSASELELVCNDGGASWDKAAGGGNHRIPGAGLWTLVHGKLSKYSCGAGAGTGETGDVSAALAPAPAVPEAPAAVACAAGEAWELAASKGGVVLLYRTPWPQPHLHFRLSSAEPWTASPGQPMAASELKGFPAAQGWWALHVPTALQLEFVPNNGGSAWDKSPGKGNYAVPKAGAWALVDGRLSEVTEAGAAVVAPPAAAPAPPPGAALLPALTAGDLRIVAVGLAELLGLGGIVLLYRTPWPSPCLHCRPTAEAQWTAMPGLPLPKAGAAIADALESDFDGSLFVAHFPDLESLEFVFNDGGPHFRWDKAAGGANFRIPAAGAWISFGGRLEKMQPLLAAPTGLASTATTRSSISLSWSPAGGGVRSHRVFRDGALVKTLPGGATSYVDAHLSAAREYSYTLAAVGTQGAQGALSEVVSAKTGEAGPPGMPRDLRVASASGKGVTLEWVPPADKGGALVTAYMIARNGEAYATTLVSAADKEKVTWKDADVTQGETYTYSVAACHLPPEGALREQALKDVAADEDREVLLGLKEGANDGPSTEAVAVEAVDEMELGETNPLLHEQLKSRGITLFYRTTWQTAFAHCCARKELGWTPLPGIKLSPSNVVAAFPADEGWRSLYFPYAKSMEIVMNDGGSQWDKAPGQQNYRLATTGVFRLVHGHVERVSAPPTAPTELTAKAVDGSRISLTWKAPLVSDGEAPVACYRIFRNGRRVHTTQGAATCSFVDSNLFAFTDYEYSVVAVNNQEVPSPLSGTTSVKTDVPGPPSAPRNLRASVKKAEGKCTVALEWEPPADCGGAPVASYEVLRDGALVYVFLVPDAQLRGEAEEARPIAPEASMGCRWVRHSCSYSSLSWFKDALEWFDEDVETGSSYSYQVRAVQLGPERAEELKSGGLRQRCGSRFLDSVLPDVMGPESESIDVRVVPFMDPPRIGEQRSIIMFQAFDWGSCKNASWYTVLLGLLPELRSAGVNMLWLPPPSDSVDDHAYLPRKWYVLDNKYGSAEALQRLVTAMHEQEIVPMLDVVVNHRCASLQDSAGRWLKFEMPDWEGWAVCHNSPAVPGGTGAGVTGEPAQYAPSVDHTNPQVRQDVNAYIRYMMQEIGFRALRFDFVKGYSPHFQKDYVQAAGSPFAVAENWNGDANGLHEYVRQCQGVMAVYDFPFYYTLKRCVHANNFEELSCGGKLNGLVGRDPARAVTFVDNHDTYQLAIVGGAFGNNEQVLRGYALLLTHPGVPCVFHFDYVRGAHVREKLLELCSIRRDANIHSTSQVNICASSYGLYAAIVDGKVAVKLGTNDWSPGGGWKIACLGHEFAVWTRS